MKKLFPLFYLLALEKEDDNLTYENKDPNPQMTNNRKILVTVYNDTRAADGINGSPLNASLIDARTGRSFFRTVEIYPLMRQNQSAPSSLRNVPEIFC